MTIKASCPETTAQLEDYSSYREMAFSAHVCLPMPTPSLFISECSVELAYSSRLLCQQHNCLPVLFLEQSQWRKSAYVGLDFQKTQNTVSIFSFAF